MSGAVRLFAAFCGVAAAWDLLVLLARYVASRESRALAGRELDLGIPS